MRNLNIVFLHGWLFDSKVWHDIKKFFHKKHSIKIYDLPGYGANKTLNMEHQKYCDKIFLNANRPTIVIGFSYGGLLALKSYLSLDSYIEKISKCLDKDFVEGAMGSYEIKKDAFKTLGFSDNDIKSICEYNSGLNKDDSYDYHTGVDVNVYKDTTIIFTLEH